MHGFTPGANVDIVARLIADQLGKRLNRQIVNRLVSRGAFFLAPTILKGRTAMRVAIVNFRTGEDDLRALLDEAACAAREIREG